MNKSFTLKSIRAKNKSMLRYYSMMNPWIDFVVLVDPEKQDIAVKTIRASMDEYWDSDFEAYGDVVERNLTSIGVDYTIIYHDANDESEEYESIWDAFLDAISEHTRTRILVR